MNVQHVIQRLVRAGVRVTFEKDAEGCTLCSLRCGEHEGTGSSSGGSDQMPEAVTDALVELLADFARAEEEDP